MATTRWVDKKLNSLDNAINLLLQGIDDETETESENAAYYKNWTFSKCSDDNLTIKLNGRDVTYNVIKYSYDQISKGDEPIEERLSHKSGRIIVYSISNNINYIIDRNSDAKTFLRKVLSYTGKNEIEKNMHPLNSDFFIWLIFKVYTAENIIESRSENTSNISLDAIKGFKGDTEDQLTTVSADGESVMNIISTLSFLLESSKLNQIKLELHLSKHDNVSLVLKNSVISTESSLYRGDFEDSESTDIKDASIYLLIYIEILPLIIQSYHEDLSSEVWGESEYIKFMKKVAEDLQEKIKNKIATIDNKTEE